MTFLSHIDFDLEGGVVDARLGVKFPAADEPVFSLWRHPVFPAWHAATDFENLA